MNVLKFNGNKIRELREERGYSLAELSKKANISVSYLSEIERNTKKPSLKTIEKLSQALNISKTMLIIEDNEAISLGQKIRMARENKNWSLGELAKKTNLSVSYLSEIERGSVLPAINTVRNIAKVLDIPISTLIGKATSLGSKLKKAREEQGYTQAELAEKAGVSAGLIGQIENNKVQPSLQTIEKIAKVLATSPCYFILENSGTDDMLMQMNPALKELLTDPNVQAVLRLICDCSQQELQFILSFIKLYKKSGSDEDKTL